MSTPTIQLRSALREEDVAAMVSARLRREQLAVVASHGDLDIFKPDGKPLLQIRRRALSEEIGAEAFPVLSRAAKTHGSGNRGAYAGLPRKAGKQATVDEEGRTVVIPSAVVGYFDRQGGRFPYCRATLFTSKEVEKWQALQPLIARVAAVYREVSPARYAIQEQAIAAVRPEWRIGSTPFTTLTVNSNVLGAIHTDKGDFKEGMGVITCHRRGEYTGAILGFPKYGVGVELFDRDLVLFNSHEWHGVTEFESKSDDAERVSVVYYMRKKMVECGSQEEEFQRARQYFDNRLARQDEEFQ